MVTRPLQKIRDLMWSVKDPPGLRVLGGSIRSHAPVEKYTLDKWGEQFPLGNRSINAILGWATLINLRLLNMVEKQAKKSCSETSCFCTSPLIGKTEYWGNLWKLVWLRNIPLLSVIYLVSSLILQMHFYIKYCMHLYSIKHTFNPVFKKILYFKTVGKTTPVRWKWFHYMFQIISPDPEHSCHLWQKAELFSFQLDSGKKDCIFEQNAPPQWRHCSNSILFLCTLLFPQNKCTIQDSWGFFRIRTASQEIIVPKQ